MTSSGAPGKPFRREIELDFLRGIAILMVLDYHSGVNALLSYPFQLAGFPLFGWMGVDVFFVLSGFLVGGLLVKEWRVRGRIDGKRFLVRRGFKIWPQYYFFLALILITGHHTVRQLWGNLLNVQNYVGGIAHTWSLAVEEHAYLFLVLLLALAARWRVRMRTLFLCFAALVVCVSASRLWLGVNGHYIFGLTHTRIDGILEGVMLAMAYHYRPETFRRVQQWNWLWLGALALALAFIRWNPIAMWVASVSYDVANLMGIALMMLLYRHREGRTHTALYRFVAWIGLYSYGIYLWHVSLFAPVEFLSKYLPGPLARIWLGTGPLVLGVAAGVVTTKLVELPALRLRDRLFPREVDSPVGVPAEIEAKDPTMLQA